MSKQLFFTNSRIGGDDLSSRVLSAVRAEIGRVRSDEPCGCNCCDERGDEMTREDVAAMTRRLMKEGTVGNFIPCSKEEAKKLAPLDMGEHLRATRRPDKLFNHDDRIPEKRFGETPDRLFNQSRESSPASMAPLDMGDYIRAQRAKRSAA